MSYGKKLYKQIVYNIKDFINLIPAKGRILCLDIGEKTIGLSKCDVNRTIAQNLNTIFRTRFAKDVESLRKIIDENDIKCLVVGLPLDINGKLNKKSQSIIRITKEINSYIKLPVLMWDERNSTKAVEKFLINEVNLSRNKRKELIDSSAASWVLDGVLKLLKNSN